MSNMDSNVVKFPYAVSRRAYARKPRSSINGTPEERAALQEMVAEEIDAQIDNRPPARSLSTTARNGRLRQERNEVWRMAEAATRYWRLRIDFQSAVSWAQRMEIPEGRFHPSDPEESDRMPMVGRYREALVKQLLTPAWDTASVKWKQAALARGQHRYTDVKPERIERAIADDLAFLAAHPVRQSNRRRQS
jgi:hypothetical protein